MDTNQPASSTTYTAATPSPGLFGSKTPSSVAFLVGILLFLLPISEIKCSGTTIAHKTGIEYVLGKDWKFVAGGMMGKSDFQEKAMSTGKEQIGNTQYLAMAAIGLGLLGLLLSLAGAKAGGIGGLVTGVLAAGASVGLMLEQQSLYKASLRSQALEKTSEGADGLGLDKFTNTMNDVKPTLAFTPWFYVAVIAFLVAAFFCYRRISAKR